VLLYNGVGCLREVIHYYVQIFLILLRSKECILHFQDVRVVKFFEYFVLPVFVLGILKHLLDGHYLQSLLISALNYLDFTL
jgi:hypothetical protein